MDLSYLCCHLSSALTRSRKNQRSMETLVSNNLSQSCHAYHGLCRKKLIAFKHCCDAKIILTLCFFADDHSFRAAFICSSFSPDAALSLSTSTSVAVADYINRISVKREQDAICERVTRREKRRKKEGENRFTQRRQTRISQQDAIFRADGDIVWGKSISLTFERDMNLV